MSVVGMKIGAPKDEGLKIGRGGFLRNSKGVAYVPDAEGKLRAHGAPSAFGKKIEDTYNLQKWTERAIVAGIAVDPTIVRGLTTEDFNDEAWRERADGAVAKARQAAKANIAAERGTHGHLITELDDDEGAHWLQAAEAGEDLGLGTETQEAIVQGWRAVVAHYGFEVLDREQAIICDKYRKAGTLDVRFRLTRDVAFVCPTTGELVTITAGTVIVGDLKTGKMSLSKNGTIDYWNSYAIQVLCYVESVPFDLETQTRQKWAKVHSRKHAVIVHLPIAEALETGIMQPRLVWIDLDAARAAVTLIEKVTAWRNAKTVFRHAVDQVAPINVVQNVQKRRRSEEILAWRKAKGLRLADPTPPEILHAINIEGRTADELTNGEDVSRILRMRIERLKAVTVERDIVGTVGTPTVHMKAHWPDGAASPKSGEPWTTAEEADISQTVATLELVFVDDLPIWPELDGDGRPRAADVEGSTPSAPVVEVFQPNDAVMADRDAVDTAKRKLDELTGPARAKVQAWAAEAKAGLRPVSLTQVPSVRRFEIVRAMIKAAALWDDDTDDEIVRLLIEMATGEALPIAVRTGVAFGAIETPDVARRLVELIDQWRKGAALSFDEQERPVLVTV